MKDLTLLVMAAGMGSRFGGLKQIEPVGPNGEFIIDYTVYDALKAGFNKIVFIIKEENYDIFKETIGARVEDKIKVEYVFQKMEDIPVDIDFSERVKPWGTGHAIRAARDVINEPFAVCNADDFYGFDAYKTLAEYLSSDTDDFACVCYETAKTLTENGSVKRGVCITNSGILGGIDESVIEQRDGMIYANPLSGAPEYQIKPDTLVSMNIFAFFPTLFGILEREFVDFLNNSDITKDEFLIPIISNKLIAEDGFTYKALSTSANWFGITYREDKETIVNAINDMIENGVYPKNLWE